MNPDETQFPKRLQEIELFAWVGEDELGSSEVGLKQGLVPAGYIPLVAVDLEKVGRLAGQMNEQSRFYKKRIYLCKFRFDSVLTETIHGEPLE